MADGLNNTLGIFSPALHSMTPGQAARFGAALCRALLEEPTERGWHGALYPGNLRYTDGNVQLGEPLELGGSFTADELEYLPPELFWSGVGGPATDVYSVGLLLYAACSGGRPVFTGEKNELTADARAEAATRRMKGEALREPKEAGDELSQVILRAAAYREEERWPDLESLRCALEDCSVFAAAEAEKIPAAVGVSAAVQSASAAPEKPAAAPRPVEPGMKNAEVLVSVAEQQKAEKEQQKAAKAAEKSEKKQRAEAEKAEKKAAEKAEKAEKKAAEKAEAEAAKAVLSREAPAKKAKKGEVTENYPRPVYDVFNEKKKKKTSPVTVIVTILALAAIFLGVMSFLRSCSEDGAPVPDDKTSPTVVTPDDTQKPDEPVKPDDKTVPDDTQTPDDTTVPDDTQTPDEKTESVAFLQTGSSTWDEAAAACAMQGGHLPVVHDLSELSALIEAAEEQGVSYVWLDAKRDEAGVWRTSDGEAITYFQWFDGEPSGSDTDGAAEDCLMLWKYNGVWGYNDMRANPAQAYAKYYGGRIAVFCQK